MATSSSAVQTHAASGTNAVQPTGDGGRHLPEQLLEPEIAYKYANEGHTGHTALTQGDRDSSSARFFGSCDRYPFAVTCRR